MGQVESAQGFVVVPPTPPHGTNLVRPCLSLKAVGLSQHTAPIRFKLPLGAALRFLSLLLRLPFMGASRWGPVAFTARLQKEGRGRGLTPVAHTCFFWSRANWSRRSRSAAIRCCSASSPFFPSASTTSSHRTALLATSREVAVGLVAGREGADEVPSRREGTAGRDTGPPPAPATSALLSPLPPPLPPVLRPLAPRPLPRGKVGGPAVEPRASCTAAATTLPRLDRSSSFSKALRRPSGRPRVVAVLQHVHQYG